MDEGNSMQVGFVQRRLHWVIGVLFFALYFLTVSRWVTGDSILAIAKVTGWDWSPQLSNPLLYLLTLPVRWLPVGSQPLVLNLLSALLAALTLSQLARSVALLPHDRTRDQRQRERSEFSLLSQPTAWVPPLFASVVCGLQLTFWEGATSMTGGMLTVLLFAFFIRSILEYRILQDDRWLYCLAFGYGFAVPSDWAFIGYFPVFAFALVWTKGVDAFRPQFLIRMLILGAIGLTTYALLPAIILYNDPSTGGFMDLLKIQLGSQKNFLSGIPKTVVVLLSLTSLLPVLVMGIRFPSSIGDVSVVGAMLSNFMFRAMHLLFLGACVWVAFDPAFSPRAVASTLPTQFLTFYYLSALAVGYFSGYVMLVFSRAPSSHRRNIRENRLLNGFVSGLLVLLVVGAPLGLLFRNLPLIRLSNGDQFEKFSEMVVRNLPEEKSLILADNSYSALVVQAQLSRQNSNRDYTIVDMSSLAIGFYEEMVRSQILASWPDLIPEERFPAQINVGTLLNVLGQVSTRNPVYYLNSSFGLYFEVFYPRQRGLVTQLVAYKEGEVRPPALSKSEIDSNLSYWKELAESLPRLEAGIDAGDLGSLQLGAWLSRELNVWAVELQKVNKIEEARSGFEQALAWNPENTCVEVNLRQNEVLSSGDASKQVGLTQNEAKNVQQNYGTYEQLLSANGPIDEPSFRLLLAAEFSKGGNQRQASLNYKRASELDPGNVETQLKMVHSYLTSGFPKEAIVATGIARDSYPDMELESRSELLRLEALSHYAVGNQAGTIGDDETKTASFSKAEGLLKTALENDPKNESLFETLSQVYLFTGRYAEALTLFDRHLLLEPDDLRLLQNKAVALIRLENNKDAIAPLTKVITADPGNAIARLNRAIAYFREEDYENSALDYRAAAEIEPNHHAIFFGLGRIAEAEGDVATAITNFERYLESAPKNTDEYKKVTDDLLKLKSQ